MLSVKTTNSAKGWNARFAQIVEHGKELAKGSIALMGLVLTSAVFGLIGRAAASPRGSSVKHSGSGAEIVELNKDGSPVEPLVETDPDFSSSVSSGSSTEELLDFGGLEETSNEAIKTSHSTATPIPAVHPIADQIVRVGEPFSLTLNPIQIFSDKDNADIWFTKFSQRDGSSLPGGLSVNTVDINPVLVSTYNSTPDSFLSVVLRNDIAYATAWYSSTATLQAIDISNPVQPTLVGLSKNVPRGYAFRPVINDDYILIPSRESHQVFIVSLSDLALVGTCQTSSTVNGIAVKNRIIYVAESSSIEMFNYTDPTNPQFVGQYQTTAFEVAINKDIDVLYVAGDQGVISLDVGEPSYPVLMGFYNTTDTVGTIFLNNRLAYVGSKNNGLVVLDTSDPFQLQSRGVSKSSSSGNRISAKSDFVFVSNGYSGITITHIENPKNSSLPQNPVLLSTHRTTQACTTQVRGPYAYVADGTGGMRIIQGNWLKKSLSGTPTNANQIGNYTIQVDAEIPDSDITFSTSFNFKIQKSLSIVAPSSVVPYIEDQSIINITPPIALNTPSPIVDTSLTVNNTDAVQIATGTAGSVVSTYNTSTGVWLAKGTRLNVNILFSQLQILLKPLFHHPFSISGNVIDGYGQSENFTISFAGTHINHPPYVKIPLTAQTGCCQAIVEQPYSFSANRETIKDPDNDILTYTALYPSWASFNNETLTFSGTPNQVGVFDLMLIGTDPSGASANSTFTTDVRLPPPTLWTNQITLHRCDTLNLNSTHFNATCPGQEAGSLQFNFYDIQNGGFYFVDAPTIPTTSFNQSQLWNQQVQFKHPCTLTAPTFVTKVFSSEYPDITPQPASVIFYPDQPVVVNKQLTVDECGVTNITSSMLSGYNPVARSIVLYPTFFPLNLQNGHFALANAITTPLSSFSEDLTTNKQLVFVHSCNRLPPNGDLIFGDGCANSTRVPITFNFNYMPHVVMEQPLHINEKRGTILTSKHLNVVATGSDLNQVVFFPSDLRFVHFSDINGTSLDYFGQWQVANQTVQCIHTGGATDLPGFNIAASNGRLTEPPVAVNVTFNEAPVWGRKELGITQGQTVTVSLANNFLATHYGVVDNSLLFLICGNSHIDFGNVATAQMRVSNFTQMDVVNYFIQATHDGTPNAPAVNISIYDGLMTTDPTPVEITFRYAVAFSLLNNQFTIHENTTKILTTQNLDVSNPANYQATAIEYTVSNIQHCRFENSDNPGAFSDPFKFTKQNLLDGKISIIHDGSKSSPSWDVAVKAGNEQIAATPTFIRFTNSPPILIKSELTVVEGKTSNITAGNFNATDVDTAPNKLIFAITNLVHGSFVYANTTAPAIYSFSLQKVLDKQIQFIHDGSEIKPTFSIAVSNDETKVSTEPKEATVAFTNLPPTIVNNKIIIQEGGRLTLGQANLYATDTGTTAAGITYNVTNLQHGRFEKIDPQTGEVVTNFTQDDITFTQDDIAFGRIVFTHDRSKYPPSYTIVATDGHVISDKSTVAVEGYKNLPPTLTAKSIRVNQGQTIFLNASNFNTTDVDPNFNGTITFNVTDVRYGHFAYAATPTSPISIFSLQDVRDGRVVVFVHDGSQNKPSFNVTAYDGYETDPVIAQVGEVQFNHKPVVSNPIASQPQCCGSSIGYPYSFAFADNTFIDPDSTDTLTYTATQADGSPLPNGMNFDSNTRTFTWTPDNASLIGSLNFKVTATDSGNPPLSVSDSFALNITKSLITTINSDPITYTEEQDRVLSDLIAINNSPPNAVITASVTIDPALGQLLTSSISGVTSSYNSTTGEWKVIGSTAAVNAHLSLLTFRPKALSYAPVTFFVKVTDQYDQTETGNILANGIHVNHSPYVNPDNNLAKQVPLCCEASVGKPYSFTFDANTFKDPDNDNLTYSAAKADGTALPTGMIFDSSTRTFTWTPNNATYIGNLNLKVTAFDPSGASVSDTFSLAIAKTISATNSTAPLAYTEEVEQKLSSIVINTPSGTATARLVLSNKLAGSLTTGTSGNVTSTYDAQTGTWSASGNKVDVNSLLENLTFKPAALFYAPFNIAVSINDGYEQSLESSISATGTHVNHPPVVNKHLQEQTLCCSAAVGNSYAFTFDPESFTDPDKDTLTYNATLANGTALPTWLQFNPTTRTFFGTPNNATQIGDLNLKVIASDPSGASVSDIFTLTIAKTLSLEMQSSSTTYTEEQDKTLSGLITINNSPPIAVITASVTIDPSLGQLLTSSISGVTSSYNSTTGEWKVIGSTAAVNAHLSLLTFRPKALSYAPVTFSVKVTDQYNQTETGNILANGIHVNHTPVVNTSISLQPQCCAAGIGNLYTFVCASDTFKDPDGDALTYAATLASDNPLPNWLNFNPTTLTFSGTPNDASQIGNLSLKITATDNGTPPLSASDTFTIGISKTLAVTNATQAINYTEGAPLKLSPILVNSPSTTATVQLKLSIPAAGSLNTATSGNVTSEYNNTTGIWAASGNKGDVNALLANLTFTPKPLSYIPFDITADITDGYEQTSTSTMHATGTHINHNPVVSNPIASQPQCCDASVGNPYSFAFAANTFTDPDSTDTLTYTATQADGSPLPNGMTFDTKTRTFTWTPDNASLIGSLNLKVTATDSGNPPLSVSDSFTLNIAKTLSISRVTSDFVYTEDHEQIISPIEITTPSPTITAKVTLREHADGELLTETISGITSTYNKNTGEWQAAGNTAAINALLSRLKFKPRNYFYGSVHLDAEVADIFKQTENGTITGTGIHVNHPPIIIGSRKDQPECITANIGEEHNCTTIPGSVYDPDGDPITTITTLENGSALPLGLYYAPNRMAVLGAINNASYTGTWKFVFKATDSYNLSTTDVYTVQSSQTLFAVGLNTPFTYTQDDTTRIPAFEVVTPSNSVVACFNTNDTKAGNILSKAMIVSSAQFFTGEGGSCFNDTVPQANTLLARLDYTPPTSYRDNFILAVKFTDEFGQTVFGNRTATGLPAETKINATPYIIISTVAGSLVLAGAGALTIVWCRNKNKPHRKFLSEDILEGVRLNPIAFGKNIIIKPESIEKIKLLGKGGAGEVYLAKWNGSLVALKILTICSQANQENIQNSFETEAAVMINLRHENIIRFLGLCQNPPSLVMEYMQLGSLDKVLASDIPLAWALRLKIAYDILKGLAYLHSLPNPIIHRDLKSPNILLDRNFKAKITDFGISTARALIQATTYTNGGGGTMAWMAPEQINNPNPNIDTSSKKSDIYSFGMICWEIATRQLPGCTPYIIIQQATSGTRPKIPEGTPPKFSEIITRCWAQVPNARPEAQALVKEFEQLVPEEPDVNTTPQSLPLSEARHSTLMPPPKASAKPNMQGPKNLHTKPTLNLALPQSSSPNPLYTYSGPANKQKPNVRQAPGFATPNPMYVPHASITPAGRAL